jgi:hypothetical protein
MKERHSLQTRAAFKRSVMGREEVLSRSPHLLAAKYTVTILQHYPSKFTTSPPNSKWVLDLYSVTWRLAQVLGKW